MPLAEPIPPTAFLCYHAAAMARHAISTLALSILALIALSSFTSAQSRDETGQPAPRFRARTTTG